MTEAALRIITLANIKGGVGKTTATVNLAYLMATEFGQRVLVIDADDQGNATKALGAREASQREPRNLWTGLSERRSYTDVMTRTPYERLWVVPATKQLRLAQTHFAQSARRFKLFKSLLRGVQADFDVVLVDTKPQINILLQAALAASTWYLIPSFPESDSYDGLVDLLAECEEIRVEENERLRCLGVFFACVKRTPAHAAYLDFVVELLRTADVPVFANQVRVSNAIATGSLKGVPAVSLQNSAHLKQDYGDLTRAVLASMARAEQAPIDSMRPPDLTKLGFFDRPRPAGVPAAAFEPEEATDDDQQLFAS